MEHSSCGYTSCSIFARRFFRRQGCGCRNHSSLRRRFRTISRYHLVRRLTAYQVRRCAGLAARLAIVAEVEAEQALVSVNRELATKMEQRIQDAIAQVWEG